MTDFDVLMSGGAAFESAPLLSDVSTEPVPVPASSPARPMPSVRELTAPRYATAAETLRLWKHNPPSAAPAAAAPAVRFSDGVYVLLGLVAVACIVRGSR